MPVLFVLLQIVKARFAVFNQCALIHTQIMANRGCKNSPATFCNVCGEFIVKNNQRNINDFGKNSIFWCKNQEKYWPRHKVCCACVEDLRKRYKKEMKSFKFAVPMVGGVDVSGYSSRKK